MEACATDITHWFELPGVERIIPQFCPLDDGDWDAVSRALQEQHRALQYTTLVGAQQRHLNQERQRQ